MLLYMIIASNSIKLIAYIRIAINNININPSMPTTGVGGFFTINTSHYEANTGNHTNPSNQIKERKD